MCQTLERLTRSLPAGSQIICVSLTRDSLSGDGGVIDHVPSVRLVAALSIVEGSDECSCDYAGGLLAPAWQLILNSEAPPPAAVSSVGAH